MIDDNGLVSVIITTYCGADNIARSIKSVLNQTYQNFEIIVVDDNDPNSKSRIDTEKIIEGFKSDKIIYIKHPQNFNGSVARNTGISVAKGRFIQFLDDDDYFFPEKIELSLCALRKNSDCQAAVTGVIAFGDSGVVDLSGPLCDTNNYIISKEWLKRFNALGTGSNIFATAESIRAINCFDTTYHRMQDLEFVFRYCNKFKVCAIKQRLIVKSLNGRPVKINSYKKHAYIINKFIKQFNIDIEYLIGIDGAKFWKQQQYEHLFRIALSDGDIGSISEARKDLEQYRPLSFIERLKVNFPKCWVRIKNNKYLYKFISLKRQRKFIPKNLENLLTQKEKEGLDFFIENFSKL